MKKDEETKSDEQLKSFCHFAKKTLSRLHRLGRCSSPEVGTPVDGQQLHKGSLWWIYSIPKPISTSCQLRIWRCSLISTCIGSSAGNKGWWCHESDMDFLRKQSSPGGRVLVASPVWHSHSSASQAMRPSTHVVASLVTPHRQE